MAPGADRRRTCRTQKAGVQRPKEITELKDAIRATHGCESLHVESIPVKEVFEGQTAWEGTVEVFDLVGHPKAKRAYAWRHRDGDQNKTFAVLEIPPVDSPESAVKVAIASKARSNYHWQKWCALTTVPRPEHLRSGMKTLASRIDRELQLANGSTALFMSVN